MENEPNTNGFSVDFLLSQVSASASATYVETSQYADLVLQTAKQTEAVAQSTGDDGNQLVQEVEAYLLEAADDMEQFVNLVQQLGDACLDHSIEHEIAEESADSSGHSMHHSSGGSSHGHHDHGTSTSHAVKKRKAKKRQRRSLLDFYIWHLQQAKETT